MKGGTSGGVDLRSQGRALLGARWFSMIVLVAVLAAACGAGPTDPVNSYDSSGPEQPIATSSTSVEDSPTSTTDLSDEDTAAQTPESPPPSSDGGDVASTSPPESDSAALEEVTTTVAVAESGPVCTGELPVGDSLEADPPWREGDRFDLTVTMEGQNRLDGSREYFDSYPVELTVLSQDSSGWDFQWEADRLVVEGILIPARALDDLEELLDELPRRRFTYHMSADRLDVSILNLDELRADIGATFDAVAPLDPGPDSPLMLTADYFRGLDDDGVEYEVGRRAMLLHLFEGISFAVDEPDVTETTIENPFGGDPVPAVERLELVTPSDGNGCVVFRYSESIDHERARPVLIESMRSALGDDVDDLEDDELIWMADDLELGQEITMTYDPGSGFVRRMEDRSQTISPEGWFEDIIVVELAIPG